MDQSQQFGQKVHSFITDMRARSTEPHQKMMLEVRSGGWRRWVEAEGRGWEEVKSVTGWKLKGGAEWK